MLVWRRFLDIFPAAKKAEGKTVVSDETKSSADINEDDLKNLQHGS